MKDLKDLFIRTNTQRSQTKLKLVQIIIQITQKSCLILVIKELKARFFSYDNTDHNRVTVDSHQKYLLPRVELKITTLKLMEEIFMISQLLT